MFRQSRRKIVAAISVSAPANRMTEERRTEILGAMEECCATISWNLGYRPGENEYSADS